jgi:hypothetical protein
MFRTPLVLPRRRPLGPTSGVAVLTAMVVLMILSGMAVTFLGIAADSKSINQHEADQFRVKNAAESAARLATHYVWSGFEEHQKTNSVSLWAFGNHLSGLGINDESASLAPVGTDVLSQAGLPRMDGAYVIGDVEITELNVVRVDTADGVRLSITAVGVDRLDQSGSGARREALSQEITEVVVVERASFDGLDYAILGEDLSCAFCHMHVDNASRVYNFDPALAGTFDRVKTGMLGHMHTRGGTSGSTLGGSLYLADKATYTNGYPITNWKGLDMKAYGFNNHGKIYENSKHKPTLEHLKPANPSDLKPLENLYVEYGKDGTEMVDGGLPDEFPSVFPDDGGIDPVTGEVMGSGAGNRIIDPEEFAAAAAKASGSLSGGEIYLVAPGNKITSNSKAKKTLNNGNISQLDAVTTGNLILTGKQNDPIQLNGELFVDGDVVIAGYVKGLGTIKAKGNIYIAGDLKYLDGKVKNNVTFSQAEDGTENGLALAAGGNILVGDMFHGAWKWNNKMTGDYDGSFSFIMDQISIFNKQEWLKTQPKLPGKWDDNWNPNTYSKPNPYYQGEDYIPRYFQFGDENPVPIMAAQGYYNPSTETWIGPERPASWNSWSLFHGDEDNPNDPFIYGWDGQTEAVVSNLGPTTDWIGMKQLETLIRQSLSKNNTNQKTLSVDANLYSANSIFGLSAAPWRTPFTNGELTVNGTIVASAIGLLAPYGLNVNYDDRAGVLLDIAYDSKLQIRRLLSMSGGHHD